MFNGLIYHTGEIKLIKRNKNSMYLGIKSNLKFKNEELGSSISCNGVCLTLVKINKKTIFFYISNETVKRTNFKNIKVGQKINLEKSIIYGQRISGNFTQGHVYTTARVTKIELLDKSWSIQLKLKDNEFSKFLVEKASISINGVSLTISKVLRNIFYLNIIPHTLNLTNLKDLIENDQVNVELDIFGKYIYKYIN